MAFDTFAALIGDQGVDFGDPIVEGPWAKYIFYYKLTLDPAGIANKTLKLKFADESGWIAWKNPGDLKKLVELARTKQIVAGGAGGLTPFKAGRDNAPDIRIVKPGYMIFHLDPLWNWHYLPGSTGVRSADDSKTQFRGLLHYPDSHYAELPAPLGDGKTMPADPCYVLSFAVTMVQDLGINQGADVTEKCNMYVQIGWDTTHCVPLIIDPDIKNSGGDDP